jgi:hypothetical protein
MPKEVVFEVTREDDGGYCAQAVGASIFTEGDTWEELRKMAWDAAKCHFDESIENVTLRLKA